MKKELDDKLSAQFPHLYADRNASKLHTCMCWGFPGNGWFDIIWELSEKLEALIVAGGESERCRCGHLQADHDKNTCTGEVKHWRVGSGTGTKEDPVLPYEQYGTPCECRNFQADNLRAAQVKEKFGGLRFYLDGGTKEQLEEAAKYIEAAEDKSFVTCEVCSATGEVGGPGWLKVLCTECRSKGASTWREK